MIDPPLLLVLDAGTSSVRALLYSIDGRTLDIAQLEISQYYPRPGWVEHDPTEIWQRTLSCAREVVARAGGGERISAIGIANQRETAVAWDRSTGEPLTRAIVATLTSVTAAPAASSPPVDEGAGWIVAIARDRDRHASAADRERPTGRAYAPSSRAAPPLAPAPTRA